MKLVINSLKRHEATLMHKTLFAILKNQPRRRRRSAPSRGSRSERSGWHNVGVHCVAEKKVVERAFGTSRREALIETLRTKVLWHSQEKYRHYT